MSVKDKAAAIDRFVRTIKASGVYDDIQAACIMAGWTNLAGALYPLKGSAPTNVSGLFQNADLDPGIGLKGNGSTKYLDSNRAENADPQDDAHISTFSSSPAGSGQRVAIGSQNSWIGRDDAAMYFRRNQTVSASIASPNAIRFLGASRDNASGIDYRINNATYAFSRGSTAPSALNFGVFRQYNASQYTDATISWYSIGSATDLAALDSAVSTLMADLRSIDEAGFDRDALAYIRNVEAADGAYLETGVKQAINAFVVGCKADGIWDALKASCIMCGARTISGALVPLKGTDPTPFNFASGDYSRSSGLVGDRATKYLDSNRANDADGQDDKHLAVYATAVDNGVYIGTYPDFTQIAYLDATNVSGAINSTAYLTRPTATGFMGVSRLGTEVTLRTGGAESSGVSAATTHSSLSTHVFGRNTSGSPGIYSGARLAFYSIGSSPDLAALDARVSTLVAAIAAAI